MLGIQLEVTTKCNSHCSFCPRDEVIKSGRRKIEDITLEAFSDTVQALKESRYEFDWISISGLGEPLLYPDLIEAIRIIKHNFPDTLLKMNTNALSLIPRRLIDSGLDRLVCSLNVAYRGDFEEFKRINYDKVETNIRYFLASKGNHAPETLIRVNAFDINLPHIKKTREYWKKYLNENDHFAMGRFSNWAGKIDRHKFVAHDVTEARHVCKFLDNERAIAINLDGSVFPCCVAIAETSESPLYLGNIHRNSLKEIYESPKMRHLIETHQIGEYIGPCKNCDSWGVQVENLSEFRARPSEVRSRSKISKAISLVRRFIK